MVTESLNTLKVIKLLVSANFYVAVLLLVVGGLLSVSDSYSFFQFNEDLYGALDNNLRMMMFYLAITEIVILIYCWLAKNYKALVLVGFFLILMIGSLQFYGEVNTVDIDESFPLFLLYIGISHIVFGIMGLLAQQTQVSLKQ